MSATKVAAAAALIAAMVFGAVPPTGGATAAPAMKRVAFKFHADDPGSLLFPQSCSVGQAGVCRLWVDGGARLTGGLDGFDHYHGWGWFDPADGSGHFDIWEDLLSVTVRGCGHGTMLWHGTGTIPPNNQDPSTLKIRAPGTWHLAEGSGTGQLAGVTAGVFTGTTEITPGTQENHEDYNGSIMCGRR